MSGNLWMFSDMLDDEDIEMQKHDFITLYQGADYYGLGLKVFTRMAREAGSVYKIGKKALIRRTIFDEYLRKVYVSRQSQFFQFVCGQHRLQEWIFGLICSLCLRAYKVPTNRL